MKQLAVEEFATLLKERGIKPRLRRDIRFASDAIDWPNTELLAVADKSGHNGVLLVDLADGLRVLSYSLLARIADTSGRSKPITCDFCYTWQRGGNAGRITFTRSDGHTITFLCCADLQCSLHVRNLTPESLLSRTQLREDLTVEQRVRRLSDKLARLCAAVA